MKIEEVVTDKAYHGNDVLKDFEELDLRTYVSEPDRGWRKWRDDTEGEAQAAVMRHLSFEIWKHQVIDRN